MVPGQVAQARSEPADRLQRPVARIAPFVGHEPCVHGIADEGRDWAPGALRPRTEGTSLILSELDLHTRHVREGSIDVNCDVHAGIESRGPVHHGVVRQFVR